MADNHWSSEELVARLYGVGPNDSHFESCEECRTTWEKVLQKRKSFLSREVVVSDAVLAAQRRAITDRIKTKHRFVLKFLLPSVAAVVVLLAALLVFHPTQKVEPEGPLSDRQFFEDVYSMVSSPEPRALGPVRSLFEVRP